MVAQATFGAFVVLRRALVHIGGGGTGDAAQGLVHPDLRVRGDLRHGGDLAWNGPLDGKRP